MREVSPDGLGRAGWSLKEWEKEGKKENSISTRGGFSPSSNFPISTNMAFTTGKTAFLAHCFTDRHPRQLVIVRLQSLKVHCNSDGLGELL
jgi:hypothetical protein